MRTGVSSFPALPFASLSPLLAYKIRRKIMLVLQASIIGGQARTAKGIHFSTCIYRPLIKLIPKLIKLVFVVVFNIQIQFIPWLLEILIDIIFYLLRIQ